MRGPKWPKRYLQQRAGSLYQDPRRELKDKGKAMGDDLSCNDRVDPIKSPGMVDHEKQARHDRNLLQAVMNGAKNSHLAFLDRDFNYLCVNEIYAAYSDCTPEEMIGKNHFDVHPHPENERVFKRIRDTGETFEVHAFPFEFPNHPEWGLTWWDWTLSCVKDHAGEVTGLVFSLFDITKRRRTEEQILDMNNELERRVQQRTLEFQHTLHDLQTHQIELQIQNDELRRMQVRLDTAHARYYDLYNLAPVSYFTISEQGLILEANLTAATLLGVVRTELHSLPFTRFVCKDDQDIFYLNSKRFLAAGVLSEYDLRMKKDDGTPFWGHLITTVVQGDHGAPVCRVIVSDITRLKQAEEQQCAVNDRLERAVTLLRASEQKYASLVEVVSDMVWEVDPHGRFTYLSANFQSFTGYPASEFLGRTPLDLVYEDGNAHSGEHFLAIVAARKPFVSIEYTIMYRDGQQIMVDVSGTPLFNAEGEYLGMCGKTSDITERKQLEQKLRNSEEQYRMLFYNAADAIIMLDMNTKIISVNESACRQYGYTKEEFLKLSVSDLDVPEESAHVPARIAQLERHGHAFFEATHRDVNGRHLHIEANATTILFNGKPCIMSTCRDISERKKTEEQLKILNDELEKVVERRTLKLQETQRRYLHAEKLSAVGKLSASIAHEFGNPLLSIMFFLQGLQGRVTLGEEDRQFLQVALGECGRLKELIRSLRDFNRPSSGRRISMNLHESLDSILLLLKNDFNKKKLTLLLDYTENLPQIKAVPDQIKQVFLNLLTNAADACQLGGGVVTVSTRLEAEKVAVVIKDTGVGIEPAEMEHIFRPFYTTKSDIHGTGLGLSISYGIVKEHRGEIRVESQQGEGTVFTVLLPIKSISGDRKKAVEKLVLHEGLTL